MRDESLSGTRGTVVEAVWDFVAPGCDDLAEAVQIAAPAGGPAPVCSVPPGRRAAVCSVCCRRKMSDENMRREADRTSLTNQ